MAKVRRFAHVGLTSALALMSASVLGQETRPNAEGPADQAQAPDSSGVTTGDIVVTARRRVESLQDVPQTITAVSGASIEKLNLLRTEDVVAVVPGLSIVNNGGQTTASIRGVSIDSFSNASPTVDLYFNETPIDAGSLFSALYDVGQIEVLRGPQGTQRGRSAPSGAITLSTRRADLGQIGGYGSMTGTMRGGINGQAAINLPIMMDRLAVRVAGVVDRDRAGFVRSVAGPQPDRLTLSGRATLTARPVGGVDLNLVYQRISEDRKSYAAVEGAGSPGGVGLAAGYNGPAIDVSDRLSVEQSPSRFLRTVDLVTGTLGIALPDHQLSYVGGYQASRLRSATNIDNGNFTTVGDVFQRNNIRGNQTTQELRLASDRPGAFLDYTVGFYYARSESNYDITQPAAFLAGAFGAPNAPANPQILDPRYQLGVFINGAGVSSERSVFGTLTAHLGPRTELSIGGRYLRARTNTTTTTRLGAAQIAVAIPAPCQSIGFGSTYPGFCDFPVAAPAQPILVAANRQSHRPFIYNASLSHRVSDSVNVYANVGSSWRQGPVTIGLDNPTNNPVITALTFLQPERSKSYEVGAKTTFFDRRLRLNVAVFRQDFNGFIIRLPETPYVRNNGAITQLATFAFNANADAKVTGFDVDGSFAITPNWTIGGGVSYADGKLNDAIVPCRDSNFDGMPDLGTATIAQFQAAGRIVAFCKSKQATTRDAKWSASGQSEFFRSFGRIDGYVRALVNYRPRNTRQDPGFVVDNYALVNMYAGIRSPDGAWDIGVFAKNSLNNGTQLSRAFQGIESLGGSADYFGSTGYRATSYTVPRELGLSARYSFGSR